MYLRDCNFLIAQDLWQAHVHNLSEENHKNKCRYRDDDKKCQTCGIKYKYCTCFLE